MADTTFDVDRLDAVLGRFIAALGDQAGERATRHVVTDAGCTRFRRAAQTSHNLAYAVRP